jgi:hypothetical protein
MEWLVFFFVCVCIGPYLGGPGADPNYKGGIKGTPEDNRAALQRIRLYLQEKMTAFTK